MYMYVHMENQINGEVFFLTDMHFWANFEQDELKDTGMLIYVKR
jgi:hypothetical protein